MTERIVAAFVPLVDCAVLVAAREQGFAAEAGLDLVLV
jgi:NitT/TauT family transport system ATP-binding protein